MSATEQNPTPSPEEQCLVLDAANREIMGWLTEIGTLPKVKEEIAARFADELHTVTDLGYKLLDGNTLLKDIADSDNYFVKIDITGDVSDAGQYAVVYEDEDFVEEVVIGASRYLGRELETTAYEPFHAIDVAFFLQAVTKIQHLRDSGQLPDLSHDYYDIEI